MAQFWGSDTWGGGTWGGAGRSDTERSIGQAAGSIQFNHVHSVLLVQ